MPLAVAPPTSPLAAATRRVAGMLEAVKQVPDLMTARLGPFHPVVSGQHHHQVKEVAPAATSLRQVPVQLQRVNLEAVLRILRPPVGLLAQMAVKALGVLRLPWIRPQDQQAAATPRF